MRFDRVARARPMTATKLSAGDIAITGDLVMADGARMQGNLRCEGDARLGKGAHVAGNVDVGGALVVRANVAIEGALACGGDVQWDPTARASVLRAPGEIRVGNVLVAKGIDARDGAGPAPEGSA